MHLLFVAAPTSVSSTGSSSLYCFMNNTESDNVPGRLILSSFFLLKLYLFGHNWRSEDQWLPNWAVLFCTPGLATTVKWLQDVGFLIMLGSVHISKRGYMYIAGEAAENRVNQGQKFTAKTEVLLKPK